MTATEEKLSKVLEMIESIESVFNVSVLSRGGSYGSSKLVLKDNETGEEVERT